LFHTLAYDKKNFDLPIINLRLKLKQSDFTIRLLSSFQKSKQKGVSKVPAPKDLFARGNVSVGGCSFKF
ncbi:hypothetical protein, partial [Bacillus pumilus]|uniref:hypothetical protein n=1 Tax=Bacillus pumilus TaxID=1408 RepID=UPI001C92EA15